MSFTQSERIFALVDCNNFYVSCERVFNPKLENKPVVVLSNNDGCAISLSNEAKKIGLTRAMPIFRLKNVVEKYDVQVCSSNYSLYGDMSRRVMEALNHFSPHVEIYSIDEAFVLLTGNNKKETDYVSGITEYAKKMSRTIYQWTGIPVSVGLGSTKTLAKLANHIAKKNPQYDSVFNTTDYPDIDQLLNSIDVTKIWGVGRRYANMLKQNNINTAYDLKNAEDKWIKKRMTIVGLRTVWELRGISCLSLEEVVPAKQAIVCSRSFGKPIEAKADLQESVATFVSRAAEKLRKQQSLCSVVSVFLETNRFKPKEAQYSNSILIRLPQPTAHTPELSYHVRKGMEKIFKPGYKYKRSGVMLMGIVATKTVQFDFFIPPDKKKQKLMDTIDKINNKFGRDTVRCLATGVKQNWRMRQELLSSRFTTKWDEMLKISI